MARTLRAGAQSTEKDLLRVVVDKPAPGVWELNLQNGRVQRDRDLQERSPLSARYTLTLAVTP
jgi:hypothetical protein